MSYGNNTNPISLHSDASPILIEKVSDAKKSANEAMISMVDISGVPSDQMNVYQSYQKKAQVNDFIYQRTVNKEASKNSFAKQNPTRHNTNEDLNFITNCKWVSSFISKRKQMTCNFSGAILNLKSEISSPVQKFVKIQSN